MHTKPIKRFLPVQLTTSEKVEFGQKLAQAHQEYGEVEREKKHVADKFKERLEVIDGRTSQLATIVHSGEELRDVGCQWRYLFEANTKELMRMDTGEIVETAAITPEERQLMLQIETETEIHNVAEEVTE